jgi:hypothetical protein
MVILNLKEVSFDYPEILTAPPIWKGLLGTVLKFTLIFTGNF